LVIASYAPTALTGRVITPAVGTLTLVGVAPNVAQSKIITPSSGALILVGGTAIISNPNWNVINTTQTPGWVQIAA